MSKTQRGTFQTLNLVVFFDVESKNIKLLYCLILKERRVFYRLDEMKVEVNGHAK